MSLLDPRWKYRPSTNTSVADTLRRFGFKPTTQAERDARQKRGQEPPPKNVTKLERKAKKSC